MRLLRILTGLAVLFALLATGSVRTPRTYAEESTSYRLTTDFPNVATPSTRGSTSYTLQEDTVTWRMTRGVSTSYQIVPPTAESAGSTASGGGGASPEASTPGGGGETGGGCRPGSARCATPPSSATSAYSPSSVRSGAVSSARSAASVRSRSSVRPGPSIPSSGHGAAPELTSSASARSTASETSGAAVSSALFRAGISSAGTDASVPSLRPEGPETPGEAMQRRAEERREARERAILETFCKTHPEDPLCTQLHEDEPGKFRSAPLLRSIVRQILGTVRSRVPSAIVSAVAASLVAGTFLILFSGMFRWIIRWWRWRKKRLSFIFLVPGKRRSRKKHRMIIQLLIFLLTTLLISLLATLLIPRVFAETTSPLYHVYNGRLLDSTGAAVTTARKIRFSYWKSADLTSGDVTATGAINVGASNYASWYEVQTFTPDSSGYFSLNMGSGTALPAIDSIPVSTLLSLHLQVEIKAASAADTTYEVLDTNTSDATKDRSPVLSVPFALNADMVDRRGVGTGSGTLPVLQSGGLLGIGAIPGGTNRDIFTIDANDTSSSLITLKFGETLAKTLSYDIPNGRFNFNANVRIQGNLTVTGALTVGGLINGVNLSTLGSTDRYLKVSSGAGLAVSINGGSYRLNGTMTNYAGAASVSLTNNTTNYIYFTGTGLVVSAGGSFPNNVSFLPLAEVATSGGAITTLTDRRILTSDNREEVIQEVLHPEFKGSSLVASGSISIGQLSVQQDSATLKNYYQWTSTKSALNGYDIFVRYRLPSMFVRWNESIFLTYKSSTASAANNRLDLMVYDTAGNPVTLSGSFANLASTTWQTNHIEFQGTPTWTAGQDITLRFKLSAKDGEQIHLGDVRLDYVKFNSP